MNIFLITQENRDDLIKKASRVLKEGGLVIYPTDTLYGLGGNALDKSSIKKVFMAKKRPASSPLPIAVSSIEMMKEYSELSKKAEMLAMAFLPGALTLVLKKKNLPETLTGGLPNVGVRIPKNDTALGIVDKLGVPITATSANISGRDPPVSAEEAAFQIKSAGIVLNGGKMQNRVPSTVIDLTGKPKILREGAVRRIEIKKVIGEVL